MKALRVVAGLALVWMCANSGVREPLALTGAMFGCIFGISLALSGMMR